MMMQVWVRGYENEWHKGQDDDDWDNDRETTTRMSDKYNDAA